MMDIFAEIAADAWDSGKSDYQRQVEEVTHQDATPEPVLHYRLRLLPGGDYLKCRLCGRDDQWVLENDDNPVFVCEWDCDEHQPIQAGPHAIRQVDSISFYKVNFAELVNMED